MSSIFAKKQLSNLLRSKFEFQGANTQYGSHSIHSFAAKFPPQLPAAFILNLTEPGEIVLDPMAGSGTALVEALLAKRRCIGIDLDPLACLIADVKTRPAGSFVSEQDIDRVIFNAVAALQHTALLDKIGEKRFDEKTRLFLDYWFLRPTQHELLSLLAAIDEEQNPRAKQFFKVVFSSIIVTKSGGVSLARDLAHSRPHRDSEKPRQDAFELFRKKAVKALRGLRIFEKPTHDALVMRGDVRSLPLQNNVIHLIVTSPPYANAIDYMRAHKFSLVWLGYPIDLLSTVRSSYIGAEKQNHHNGYYSSLANTVLKELDEVDQKRSKIVNQYFAEMLVALKEMYRVLTRQRYCIVVVGPSTVRGLQIPTQDILAELAEKVRFQVIDVIQRQIDRDRRMLPASFARNSNSMIEQRIHEEYVLVFRKR